MQTPRISARSFAGGSLALAAVLTLTSLAPSPAAPAAAAQPEAGPVTATLSDQDEVAVTVYNSNIALVRDVRRVRLYPGASEMRFVDIAAAVNPATVHVRSLTDPSRFEILEQNYQYDLLDPQRLLRKYVGRDVTLVRTRQDNGSSRTEEVSARLLAYNEAPVWRIGNEIVTGFHPEQYRFPEIPQNLHSRPTLVWQLQNGGPAEHRVETSYLTGNMTWNADYVLTVARDDAKADLDGWVTVRNTSGAAYTNAKLQLVAGELNRVADGQALMERVVGKAMREDRQAPEAFAREAFSEYHLYALNRRTTLLESEIKQISMLSGGGVPVKKLFVVNGQQFYYRNRHHPGSPLKDAVRVFYKLRNEEAAGLGVPMPAGIVRVYQADSKGGVQFAGEDRIDHTPKDEDVTLQIGSAFDIMCERKQTDWEKIAGDTYEMAFEIRLRNHKATPVTIEVNEPIAGDWTMLSSTHQARKTDAWAAQFNVTVGTGEESVLRYRVRVRW